MVIVGLVSKLPAILEALNPSGSIEGAGQSIRLDDPPGAVSADGLRCAWVDGRWGETEREWFVARGAGLVDVLDALPAGWYPAAI